MNTEYDKEINELDLQISELRKRHWSLTERRREFISRQTIKRLGLTRDNVQFSSDDDVPWFGDVWHFASWLDTHCRKLYAEWNGIIYPVGELLAGRMTETGARAEHLESVETKVRK